MPTVIRSVFLTALGIGAITYEEAVSLTEHCQKQLLAGKGLPLPQTLVAAADKVLLLEKDAGSTLH